MKKYKCGIFEESLIVLYRDRVYRVSYPGSKWRINHKGKITLSYIPKIGECGEFSLHRFEFYILPSIPQTISYNGKLKEKDLKLILEHGKKV